MPNAYIAGAGLIVGLREYIPLFVAIVVGNTLVIAALYLIGESASGMTRTSLERNSRVLFTFITGPVLGAMSLASDQVWPRILFMALVEAWLVGQLAWQIHGFRTAPGQRHRHPMLAFETLLWILFAQQCVRAMVIVALTPNEPLGGQRLITLALLMGILLLAVGTCVMVWHELEVNEHAVALARSTDPESGFPNRTSFLQQLEAWMMTGNAGRKGSVALVQLKPYRDNMVDADPYEETLVFNKAGSQIQRLMDPSDVLARFSADKFALLFRRNEVDASARMLGRFIEELHTRGIAGDSGRHMLKASAALIACDSTDVSASDILKRLQSGLAGITTDGVRVLATPQY